MTEALTIQAYWNGTWKNAGEVIFRDPQKGLTGALQFYYDPMYINDAGTFRPGLDFIDERAEAQAELEKRLLRGRSPLARQSVK